MSQKRLTVKEKAKIALSSRLFINGWELNGKLKTLAEYGTLRMPGAMLYLHREDGKYVAVALKYMGNVEVFVRKVYRNKGIGSMLVKRALRCENQTHYAGEGVVGSEIFWNKLAERTKKIEYNERY